MKASCCLEAFLPMKWMCCLTRFKHLTVNSTIELLLLHDFYPNYLFTSWYFDYFGKWKMQTKTLKSTNLQTIFNIKLFCVKSHSFPKRSDFERAISPFPLFKSRAFPARSSFFSLEYVCFIFWSECRCCYAWLLRRASSWYGIVCRWVTFRLQNYQRCQRSSCRFGKR